MFRILTSLNIRPTHR